MTLATIGTLALAGGQATTAGTDTGETTIQLIRVFVLLVGAASLVALLARRTKLPDTVALVALGIVAGLLFNPLRVQVTPELVLVVLLPALIFEASYRIDLDKLRPSMVGVMLLAGPGVLVSAGLVALFLHLGAGMEPAQAFIVGAMLAATDPAAVIATFKQLASPRRLSTLIEAESLFNDGTGIVAFTLAVGFATSATSPANVAFSFLAVIAVSALLGLATGWAASRVLPSVGDHVIEISLSVVLAYGTYLAADAIHQSGVIATAVAGVTLGNYGRRRGLSERTEEALDVVWEFVAFLATAFVFLVVGLAISLRDLAGAAVPIFWAVLAAFVGRAIIVYGFLGTLRWLRRRGLGRGMARRPEVPAQPASDRATPRSRRRSPDEGDMPAGWLHVIYWSGLRGAVSTALALSLPADMPNRDLLQEVTFGVVLFTLLVQATTAELVVDRWGGKAASPGKAARAGASGSAEPAAAEPAAAQPAAAQPAAAQPATAEAARQTGGQSRRPSSEAEPDPGARAQAE
jgi:CPA1 family monovalent cation:H+ antiporter